MISSIGSSTNTYQTQMAQMRQNMFNRIDTNGDGKHDKDELAAMVANGPSGGPSADEIISAFDTDGDGAISESEFNTVQDQQTQGAGGPPPPPMGNISSEEFAKQLFANSDTDGDGLLSADELSAMAAKGPEGGASAEELMTKLDTDGDGSVSESEFVAGAPGQGGSGRQATSATTSDEVFDALDTNKDGYVSQAEWQAAMGEGTGSSDTSSASDILSSILSSTNDTKSEKQSATTNSELLSAIHSYLQLSLKNTDSTGLQSVLSSSLYA
jgi:Ca2+-binding EF-hand superfamily protein